MMTRLSLLLCLFLFAEVAQAQESWFLEPQSWRVEMIRSWGGSSLKTAGFVFTPEGIRKIEYPPVLLRTDRYQVFEAGEELYKPNSACFDTKFRSIQRELSSLRTEYDYFQYYACGHDARTIVVTTPWGRRVSKTYHALDAPFDPDISRFLRTWQSLLGELPREMAVQMDSPAIQWNGLEGLFVDGLRIGQNLRQAEVLFGPPVQTFSPPKQVGNQHHCRYSNGNLVIAYRTSVQAAKGKVVSYKGSILKAGMTRTEIEDTIQTNSLEWLRGPYLRFEFNEQGTLDWVFAGSRPALRLFHQNHSPNFSGTFPHKRRQ